MTAVLAALSLIAIFPGKNNSKMNNWLSLIPQKYWAYLSLLLWGVLTFILLNKTVYGIDEGAAQALLLAWSVADNVVSSIVTLGLPDFRAVILAPVGYLWTGNVLAAKIATIIVMSGAAWAFHAWRRRSGDSEGALLATGMLLISPLVLDQIDAISVAPYLLITFALGVWSDQIYRESPQAFGGMYFAQLFLCLVSTTLHPAGMAYPLALLWSWYRNPLNRKQQSYFIGGIFLTVMLALILTLGWSHVEWFANPVKGLSGLLLGSADGAEVGALRWIAGTGMLFILLLVIWKQAGNLWADLLGRTLLAALVIGMLTGDDIFGIIALTTCLYWGMPLVLQKRTDSPGGFWKQRGLALLLLVVIATTFMNIDKAHYQKVLEGNLTPRDNLIKALVENIESTQVDEQRQKSPPEKPFRIASQWPARTMLACRCDTLPLPPSVKDEQALFTMLKGINYLIFDPRDLQNSSLSHNLALMGAGKVETIVLQQGGVIVEIKGSPIEKKQ
jgi:hypothetical protein